MPDEITKFIKEVKEKRYIIGHKRDKRKTQVTLKFGITGTNKKQQTIRAKEICRLANKYFDKRLWNCHLYFIYHDIPKVYVGTLEVHITNKGQKIKRKNNKIFSTEKSWIENNTIQSKKIYESI